MSRQHTRNNDTTFAEAAQWALKNLDENGKVKERPDRSWSNMTILCVVIGVIFVLLFIWWLVSIWTWKKKSKGSNDEEDSDDDTGSDEDDEDDNNDGAGVNLDNNNIVQTMTDPNYGTRAIGQLGPSVATTTSTPARPVSSVQLPPPPPSRSG